MVVTTHMYNQMIKENQKSKNNDILENPESEVIQSFLKDSESFEKVEKKANSSNS